MPEKLQRFKSTKSLQVDEPFIDVRVSRCSMSLSESAMFFYPWYPAMMLALEASTVIDMRLWKIARGGEEAAAESRLMVKEKVDALFEAGTVLVAGGSSVHVIDMYRKHVAANALRLEHA